MPFIRINPKHDLRKRLVRQIIFSEKTFGPGDRTEGVIDHMEKEFREIREGGTEDEILEEWIDLVLLALDGAWRSVQGRRLEFGAPLSPEALAERVIAMWEFKQTKNDNRKWPDWRTVPQNKAVEHVRGEGEA